MATESSITETKRPRTTAATPTSIPGDGATTSTALGKVDEVQNQRTEAVVVSIKFLSMTLSDPDLLDCSSCKLPLFSPVYQCENGHMACAWCCTTILENKCSSCSLPIGNIRCRPIEMVIESLRATCQYNAFGCAEMLSYSEKFAHEKTCNYVPCSCPSIGCNFVGSSKHLYDHFASKHEDLAQPFDFSSVISISMESTDDHVILRERSEGVLFVVCLCIVTFGSLINVVCVAPPSSEKRWYELIAHIGGDTIKLGSHVETMSKWIAKIRPAKMCVVVPSDFISTTQQLKLNVVIRDNSGPRFCWAN